MNQQSGSSSAHSNLGDFIFLDQIGRGSYGTVYKCRRKADNQIYVLKEINLSGASRREIESAANECHLLARIDSPYVVRYYDSFVDKATNTLWLVMEYANRGTLRDLIKRMNFDEEQVWFLACQIILGLASIHVRKIIHRDIKSLNIFLMKNCVKIGDLGVAKQLSSSSFLSETLVGSPYYLSPEICRSEKYNMKSDVWALGVTLYEIAAGGRHPFQASNQATLIIKILKGRFQPLPPEKFGASLRDLISWCLNMEPMYRPDIFTILATPAVQSKVQQYGLYVPEDVLSVVQKAKPILEQEILNRNGKKVLTPSVSATALEKALKKSEEREAKNRETEKKRLSASRNMETMQGGLSECVDAEGHSNNLDADEQQLNSQQQNEENDNNDINGRELAEGSDMVSNRGENYKQRISGQNKQKNNPVSPTAGKDDNDKLFSSANTSHQQQLQKYNNGTNGNSTQTGSSTTAYNSSSPGQTCGMPSGLTSGRRGSKIGSALTQGASGRGGNRQTTISSTSSTAARSSGTTYQDKFMATITNVAGEIAYDNNDMDPIVYDTNSGVENDEPVVTSANNNNYNNDSSNSNSNNNNNSSNIANTVVQNVRSDTAIHSDNSVINNNCNNNCTVGMGELPADNNYGTKLDIEGYSYAINRDIINIDSPQCGNMAIVNGYCSGENSENSSRNSSANIRANSVINMGQIVTDDNNKTANNNKQSVSTTQSYHTNTPAATVGIVERSTGTTNRNLKNTHVNIFSSNTSSFSSPSVSSSSSKPLSRTLNRRPPSAALKNTIVTAPTPLIATPSIVISNENDKTTTLTQQLFGSSSATPIAPSTPDTQTPIHKTNTTSGLSMSNLSINSLIQPKTPAAIEAIGAVNTFIANRNKATDKNCRQIVDENQMSSSEEKIDLLLQRGQVLARDQRAIVEVMSSLGVPKPVHSELMILFANSFPKREIDETEDQLLARLEDIASKKLQSFENMEHIKAVMKKKYCPSTPGTPSASGTTLVSENQSNAERQDAPSATNEETEVTNDEIIKMLSKFIELLKIYRTVHLERKNVDEEVNKLLCCVV